LDKPSIIIKQYTNRLEHYIVDAGKPPTLVERASNTINLSI